MPRFYAVILFTLLSILQTCNNAPQQTASNTNSTSPSAVAAKPSPTAAPELPPTPAPTPALSAEDAALWAKAMKIHQSSIVIDTHNDVTSAILDDGFDMGQSGIVDGKIKTHTDIARLKAGGIGAQFFAVYVGKEFVNKKLIRVESIDAPA